MKPLDIFACNSVNKPSFPARSPTDWRTILYRYSGINTSFALHLPCNHISLKDLGLKSHVAILVKLVKLQVKLSQIPCQHSHKRVLVLLYMPLFCRSIKTLSPASVVEGIKLARCVCVSVC